MILMSGRTRLMAAMTSVGRLDVPDVNAEADDFGILREQDFRDVERALVDVELGEAGARLQFAEIGQQIAQAERGVDVLRVERG